MTNINKSGLQIARENKKMETLELAALLKGWEAGGGTIQLDKVIKLMNILDTSSEMILFNESRKGLNIETLTEEQRNLIFELYKQMKNNK